MIEKEKLGSTIKNVGVFLSESTFNSVGVFLIFLGLLFSLFVYSGFLTNNFWLIPGVTTYGVSLGGIIIGILLMAFSMYLKRALKTSKQKMIELDEARRSVEEKLRENEMELGRKNAEVERKETSLKQIRERLSRARLNAKEKEKTIRRARKELENNNKKLIRIRELARVRAV